MIRYVSTGLIALVAALDSNDCPGTIQSVGKKFKTARLSYCLSCLKGKALFDIEMWRKDYYYLFDENFVEHINVEGQELVLIEVISNKNFEMTTVEKE